MLNLQHGLYIGCRALVAWYAGLTSVVAEDSSARERVEWYGFALELHRLRIAETVSRIDLAQGLLAGLTEALPLVRSLQERITGCLPAVTFEQRLSPLRR